MSTGQLKAHRQGRTLMLRGRTRGSSLPSSPAKALTCLSGPGGWVSVLLLGRGRRNCKSPRRNVGALKCARQGRLCARGIAHVKPLPHLSPLTPDPHSRVCLTSPDPDDPLSSYINANYIRVRSPSPKASA